MSWLFAAFIPVLLMVVTFALERLEARLDRDALMASDVAEFLEQAEPGDVRALARAGLPEAMDRFRRRRMERIEPSMEAVIEAANNNGVHYARTHALARANPQFQPTRHPDSV
ncbi:MAG: hypothetical protein JO152_12080 [Mycobacteriaceae bacterium]|nr:hypothetical protein [Mycobacteriaceae bacterium]